MQTSIGPSARRGTIAVWRALAAAGALVVLHPAAYAQAPTFTDGIINSGVGIINHSSDGIQNINGNIVNSNGTIINSNGDIINSNGDIINGGDIFNTGNIATDSLDVLGPTNTNGLTNAGKIKTDSLTVTKNAKVKGDLTVQGATNTNGIDNTGHIATDTLGANVVGAGAVYAGTLNSFVSYSVVSNSFVTNSAFVNAGLVNAGFVATHGLAVAPHSYIDMGHNVVHGVADPIHDYDAANKRYVDTGLSSAFKEIDRNTQGIAIAMAMAGLTLPDNKTFTLGANVGFFEDKQAVAVQGAIRLTPNIILNGGVGTGFQDTGTVGGRVGVSAAW